MTRVTNTHSSLGECGGGGGGEEKHRQKKEVDFTCYSAGRDKNQQLENNRMNTKMEKKSLLEKKKV